LDVQLKRELVRQGPKPSESLIGESHMRMASRIRQSRDWRCYWGGPAHFWGGVGRPALLGKNPGLSSRFVVQWSPAVPRWGQQAGLSSPVNPAWAIPEL